ncbi:MAG: sigma-70 family RNA polymerase sigma factor [Oscillospiraceae bacterium]
MRDENEARRAIETYGDTVRRICFLNLKNREDTEDIFQNVFLRFLMCKDTFQSQEHEKAWMIRVTVNACKDLLKSFYRKNKVPMDAVAEFESRMTPKSSELLNIVLSLPEKYKTPIYLFYFEGYTAIEIGEMTHKNTNTVYTLLSRGKSMLKDKIGVDFIED